MGIQRYFKHLNLPTGMNRIPKKFGEILFSQSQKSIQRVVNQVEQRSQ